jgi:hypothetical protein
VPSCCDFRVEPSASYPIMRAISCTSVCTSLHPVFADRSWESLAWRHGWYEMCAFLGISKFAMLYEAQKSAELARYRVVRVKRSSWHEAGE